MKIVKIYKICPICGNDLPYWLKVTNNIKCRFCKNVIKEQDVIIERRLDDGRHY